MKEAIVFDIQRFSLHDGPGIRTLIFFKGCSLACDWCSNPEGIRFEPEIRNDGRLCIGCGKCVQVCPVRAIAGGQDGVSIDRKACSKCGTCIASCPSKTLSWWGKSYMVQQLFELARRDKPFYESSGGGVTLGGGDPLLQNEPAIELLKMCKENGINTAIETAGNYPWEYLENAAPHCDTIHFDLKAWDNERYRKNTGIGNEQIIKNLQRLDSLIAAGGSKAKLIIRTVVLPGRNYTLADYQKAAKFLAGLKSIERVELLPFHNLGENKYRQLDRPYSFQGSNNLKPEKVEEYKLIMKKTGLPVKVATI